MWRGMSSMLIRDEFHVNIPLGTTSLVFDLKPLTLIIIEYTPPFVSVYGGEIDMGVCGLSQKEWQGT